MELSGGIGSSTDCSEIRQSLNFVHIIKSSANILQFLVKDLIDLMNIKQDKFNMTNKSFSTIEACQEIITCFEVQANEKCIYLRLTVNKDDQTKIRRINGDKERY